MSDEQPQKRSLSEISHLFLSSVRDRQTNGAPRPQRIPPGQPRPARPAPPQAPSGNDLSVDLTPEEFAQVFGEPAGDAAAAPGRRTPPVTALLSGHLNGRQFDRVKEYARHLASRHGRIGLIELDASEFRLMCFEPGVTGIDPEMEMAEAAECYDMRQMAEALEEMNCDVDRWLLLVPSPRTPEAKALLRSVGHWVLLSTCDHDGVVSSYRLLKGLAESYRPRLTLALLDGTDEPEMEKVCRKLSGVCQQFLDWPVEAEAPVRHSPDVTETLVLCCRPTRDKGQLATAPQWEIVADFLASLNAGQPAATSDSMIEENMELEVAPEAARRPTRPAEPRRVVQEAPAMPAAIPVMPEIAPKVAAPIAAPATVTPSAPAMSRDPVHAAAQAAAPGRDTTVDVLDLSGPDAGAESILAAVLQQDRGDLIECPVRAPMCGEARLAVARDRSVVLLAVARTGLSELRSIGLAYRWLNENRTLIGMAVPQFAIDTTQAPRLRLLVDHADVAADVLQPMLQSDHVTVQAYRKLRWGGKTGLFLEAA
ncbi:MAG: hypothetical protein JWL69_3365 [Phycisphaerales bacterium]|nr:hypothetical protein [Phycisphaerales bacterium]MDB5356837.1 hypothetical protein [Phycisphaerales bacterium]